MFPRSIVLGLLARHNAAASLRRELVVHGENFLGRAVLGISDAVGGVWPVDGFTSIADGLARRSSARRSRRVSLARASSWRIRA